MWTRMLSAAVTIAFVIACAATGRAEDGSAVTRHADRELERYLSAALTQKGDAAAGKQLFFDAERGRCSLCHAVAGAGAHVGPDLSAIGGKFDRPHLIESLLEPSRQIVEGYGASRILSTDGEIVIGILQDQSPDSITIVDATGQSKRIPRAEVELITPSPTSVMPTGLADVWSEEEFVGMIAYLESLRPDGNEKMGAAVRGPIQIPDGFTIRTVATGIDGATALDLLPDGRVLICEQPGRVRVVQDDRLLLEPLVTLPVDSTWERGVIGVTHDPQFPERPFVYVCWVAAEPYPHHRVSRLLIEGNRAVPDSEQVLLVGDDQRGLGGRVPAGHQGGALHFGTDGMLYIAIGEQTAGAPAQQLDTFLGKILRIDRNGCVPPNNPFYETAEGKYRAIYARGLRNPFTFAFRHRDGLMLINDVGGKFEEINRGRAGANYGWPAVEHGPGESPSGFAPPVHWYPQSSINGADFSPDSAALPRRYRDRYFFADFVLGWIKYLDPDKPQQAETFAAGLRRPVDLRFTPDGDLYVLLRNAWVIDDKFSGGTGSLLKISPQ